MPPKQMNVRTSIPFKSGDIERKFNEVIPFVKSKKPLINTSKNKLTGKKSVTSLDIK